MFRYRTDYSIEDFSWEWGFHFTGKRMKKTVDRTRQFFGTHGYYGQQAMELRCAFQKPGYWEVRL